MAQGDTEQDKTEQATPFKLEEARRKGQVIKSPELNSVAALSMGLLCTLAFSDWAIDRMLSKAAEVIASAGTSTLSIAYVTEMGAALSGWMLFLLSPLLVLVALGAILSNFLQTGPVFSFEPIKPQFSRMNPVEGLKRIFSMRTVYEGLKSVVKLAVISGILYLTITHLIPQLLGLLQLNFSQYPAELIGMATFLLTMLIIAFVALAIFDYGYMRWEFMKKMRMSRREMKDEVKRREGDPMVRSKRRELQQSLRKRAATANRVKDADVLITNPTHLAVALRYRRSEMPAPKVVAKGAGELALKMRQLAFRHGVTVVESPRLARALYAKTDIDAFIPESSYDDVSRILKRVLARKRNRR